MAEPLGLEKAACLAGLFHDLGKYTADFQKRLTGADVRVDHSTIRPPGPGIFFRRCRARTGSSPS
ncbi:MAG: hypothetical protein ACT6T2_20130 [Shinella sp.]